jgi:hypothetical protein
MWQTWREPSVAHSTVTLPAEVEAGRGADAPASHEMTTVMDSSSPVNRTWIGALAPGAAAMAACVAAATWLASPSRAESLSSA